MPVVVAPPQISACEDLVLDSSSSQGVGYFDLEFSWNITRSSNTGDDFAKWSQLYVPYSSSNSIIKIPSDFNINPGAFLYTLSLRVFTSSANYTGSTSVSSNEALTAASGVGSYLRIK